MPSSVPAPRACSSSPRPGTRRTRLPSSRRPSPRRSPSPPRRPRGSGRPFTSYGDVGQVRRARTARRSRRSAAAPASAARPPSRPRSSPASSGCFARGRRSPPADDLERALATTARPVAGHAIRPRRRRRGVRPRSGSRAPMLHPRRARRARSWASELEGFSGLWSGAGRRRAAYRWERCRDACAADPECVRAARTSPTAEDAGFTIRLVLSAPGLADAVSPATAAVGARPALAGTPVHRRAARASARASSHASGSWAGTNLRYSVTWQRCRLGCSPAGTGATYRARPRDRGWRLRVEVTASNDLGAATAFSRQTARVR